MAQRWVKFQLLARSDAGSVTVTGLGLGLGLGGCDVPPQW